MSKGDGTSPEPVKRRVVGGSVHTAVYTSGVTKREPHLVLRVAVDASPSDIKAAWRKLARRHHPDLTGDDPEASRIATREMAEINEAYAAMTRGNRARRPAAGRGGASRADFEEEGRTPRRSGPPRPKPSRPVTGRLDLSGTVRPRNAPLRPAGAAGAARPTTLGGHPPIRFAQDREPPRASDPTGPLQRSRIRNFRRPAPPALEKAAAHEIDFGKFRGHTLGEVADFEPSYIDWLAKTITRDPELVAAARAVQAELDRQMVPRRDHPDGRPTRTA
jgi:curved DNA-binding protein CbpA